MKEEKMSLMELRRYLIDVYVKARIVDLKSALEYRTMKVMEKNLNPSDGKKGSVVFVLIGSPHKCVAYLQLTKPYDVVNDEAVGRLKHNFSRRASVITVTGLASTMEGEFVGGSCYE